MEYKRNECMPRSGLAPQPPESLKILSLLFQRIGESKDGGTVVSKEPGVPSSLGTTDGVLRSLKISGIIC